MNWELTEALRVVERFTQLGTETLEYQFTVEDRNTRTRLWIGSSPWTRAEGPMLEYACHEGNYGILNILGGSRAEDSEQ